MYDIKHIKKLYIFLCDCIIISKQKPINMQTHMNNTKAIDIYNDCMGKTAFANHQYTMHTEKIKPLIDNRRKSQIKIVNNRKVELNQQPMQHVNLLFKNIIKNKYKSTIDNKTPNCYQNGKKILKDKVKKNPQQNFIKQEHQRQLRSQQQRVKNCKSLAQRKKDNTDPIVNPAYFMREEKDKSSVAIDQYKNTVLKKNRPASGVPPNRNTSRKQIQSKLYTNSKVDQNDQQNMPTYANFGSVPSFSKSVVKPKSAGYTRSKPQSNSDDLPECKYKSILDHIVNNKMFRQADIKVLYVRLCHKYGEERVDQIWQPLMDELQS